MATQTSGLSAVDGGEIRNSECKTGGVGKYYVLFFLSGAPALLYQIVWQRALFAIYGVNIESVTIIVTMFMLGLGLGSLAGGRLSKIPGVPLLAVFSMIEFGIAAFGLCSLRIFHFVAGFTAGTSAFGTGIVTFVLLLIPTMLMGSTLPLLVAHLVRSNGNVGESVGALYCVNTFGSAVACFAAAYLLMNALGQSGTVRTAAIINTCVATAALVLNFTSKNNKDQAPNTGDRSSDQPSRKVIHFYAATFLCGAIGFIALGYEMLWYRLFSFASGRSARSFALMLGWYLAGLAYGSLAARDACRKQPSKDLNGILRFISTVVIWGSITGFLVGPALSVTLTYIPALELTFPLVFVAAALLGAAFPLLSHVSIDPGGGNIGTKISCLYLSNIVGCTTGSYLIGFVAMDHLSTRGVAAALLLMGLAVGVSIMMKIRLSSTSSKTAMG